MDSNIKAVEINNKFKDLDKFKKLYIEAFVSYERMPISFLLRKAKKKNVDFLALYDDDIFIGFVYLINNEDITYVLYLAIDCSIRGKGYGSASLSLIRKLKPNNRIILNIQLLDESSSNYEERVLREKFYIKNGYKKIALKIYAGNKYIQTMLIGETMLAGECINKEEYEAVLKCYAPFLFLLFGIRVQ